MKKVLLVIVLFILTSCISYKKENLLKINNCSYNVKLPKFWSINKNSNEYKDIIFHAFNKEFDKSSNGKYFIHDATISKKDFDGVVYVYLIDKNSIFYKDLLKEQKDGLEIIFLDLDKNDKTKFSKILFDWVNNRYVPKIAFYVENNYIILFDLRAVMFSTKSSYGNNGLSNRNYFDYSFKNRKEILKEFYKIINSLTREKINNQNNNAKQ